MSGESAPISLDAFAEAIQELPLSVVHAKASELRNSIAHLRRSNAELQAFVAESCDTDDEKRELEGYISENEGVIGSMNDRIMLLKAEVERRGQVWIEERPATEAKERPAGNGSVNGAENAAHPNSAEEPTEGQDPEQDGIYL
ncbi:hypothetical protein BDV59DRAFT_138947 [Aspergillus ambiguus]|uniref:uncharacterized protein n=1 Tax=Aspergillus ambiguus TaxID=176160 RepID=UPI003CCCB52B